MHAQASKQSERSKEGPMSGGQDEAPYMQGYQTTLGQGQHEEPYRRSTSSQDAAPGQRQGHDQEPYRKSASFQDVVSPMDISRAASMRRPAVATMLSGTAELEQASGRIPAVRPAGYEEAGGQGKTAAEAAGASGPPARRSGSLLVKGKQRKASISVADRLKSVRGLLDSGEENFEDIQEDLPMAAVQESDGIGNTDDAILEEPQLTQD